MEDVNSGPSRQLNVIQIINNAYLAEVAVRKFKLNFADWTTSIARIMTPSVCASKVEGYGAYISPMLLENL